MLGVMFTLFFFVLDFTSLFIQKSCALCGAVLASQKPFFC